MQKILDKLDNVKKRRGRNAGMFTARCPAHSDRQNSLSIKEENGVTLLHCFASCDNKTILESIGLTFADLYKNNNQENMEMVAVEMKKEKVEDKGRKYESIEEIKSSFKTLEDAYEYNYLGEETSILQVRYSTADGKAFATFHKDEKEGAWYSGRPDGLLPLYNINEIEKAKAVLMVEGEKVVELLREYGVHATCSLGGSNGAESTDFTSLTGKPSLAMFRDNDEAGLKYQNDVKRILGNLNINLRCVDVEKYVTGKGDDLEEYIGGLKEKGLSRDAIRGKIYSCIPKSEAKEPMDYLTEYLEKVYKGEIKNYEVPFFPLLTKNCRAFRPGSQVVIYSAGGVGKSLWIGRLADQLNLENKARVKRLHLESPMSLYMSRSLAQQSNRIEIMNEEFHLENQVESREIAQQYRDVMNIIGKFITTSDTGLKKQITEWDFKGVKDWMTRNAEDAEILIIDPVSIVLDGGSPWLISAELTKHAEQLMAKYDKLCVVWIQHTADSSSGGNVGGIAGGKAWNRYSSAVLNFIHLDEPEMYEVMLEDGTITTKEIQTYIHIKKARNGAAGNWKIGMYVDTDLSYKEIGRMLKKTK